jgi:plastocyanin
MRHLRLLSLTVLTFALLAACGPAASPQTSVGATSPAATSPAAGGSAVTIVDFAFQPATLTVKVGDTVTWTSQGDAPHTVKWSDGTPEADQIAKGGTYTRTFDAAGSFPYVCGIHGQMTGTITVGE